jgi:uncharacterized membrane protein
MKNPLQTKPKELTTAELERQQNTLRRLQTLIDVVYALMIFRLFVLLPHPTQEQLENRDLVGMFAESGIQLLVVLIGIILIIIYWGQSNRQFGNLSRIDGRVATLSIIQIFALLIYLYFMRLDNETDGDEFTLLMESVFLAIAGFIGIYNWNYSRKKGFFDQYLSSEEAYETVYKFYPEPIVAAITIPLAFLGTAWYTLGWLLLVPITWFVNKRKKKKIAALNKS